MRSDCGKVHSSGRQEIASNGVDLRPQTTRLAIMPRFLNRRPGTPVTLAPGVCHPTNWMMYV